MSKNLKKVLVAGASLLMFASIGACSINTDNTVHAESSLLRSYWKSEPQDARWESVRGAYENQANFGFNKQIGGTITANFRTGLPITVYRYGHSITVVPMLDTPGKVIRVNGHRVYTRHQVLSRLHTHAHHYRRPVRRHYRKHARKHYRRPVKKAKKHVTRKRKARKARKAIKRQTKKATAYKPSRKVNKFRKSAYYHNSWIRAEKLNERGINNDLKMAKKYAKNGNTKAAKKARQKANYLKSFVKHDKAMINLGK